MNQGFDQESNEKPSKGGWGLLGIAATVGLIAAAVVLVGRNRQTGRSWSVEDLIDAADRAAETLENALVSETARAS